MTAVRPLTVQSSAPPLAGLQASLQRHLQRVRVLRPGLHLHADDAADAQDFTACGEMEAGLRIVLLLEGSVDVSYGQRRVAMSSTAQRARVPGLPRPRPRMRSGPFAASTWPCTTGSPRRALPRWPSRSPMRRT